MGSNNWELIRDLALARQGLSVHNGAKPTQADVLRLELEVQASQATCHHVQNPERPQQCLKCSAPIEARAKTPEAAPAERPPLAKTRRSPLDISRRKAVG